MLNKIILIGKVNSVSKLKFIYNKKLKAIIEILILVKKQEIYCRAYEELAGKIYSRINKNDIIVVFGRLNNIENEQYILIQEIYNFKNRDIL